MKQNTHHYNRKRRKKTNKAAKACRKGKLQLAQYEGEEVTLHAVIQRISAPTLTRSPRLKLGDSGRNEAWLTHERHLRPTRLCPNKVRF